MMLSIRIETEPIVSVAADRRTFCPMMAGQITKIAFSAFIMILASADMRQAMKIPPKN